MKSVFLNWNCHISINAPANYIKEVKTVETRAAEKYNSSRWHQRPNKSHALMPKNSSVAIQDDLAQHLLNQMESGTEQIHWNDHVIQTCFP